MMRVKLTSEYLTIYGLLHDGLKPRGRAATRKTIASSEKLTLYKFSSWTALIHEFRSVVSFMLT